MAFGYEYLMVYLPDVCRSSFLLFVHNPAGATKLYDYSSGRERQLTTFLSAAAVLSMTEVGRTRFYYDPHVTNGPGDTYWAQVTAELNRKWLHRDSPNGGGTPPSGITILPSATEGRASKGSRRQLQDYVNLAPETLSAAVLAALPPRLSHLGATIRWVSPLACANYQECRDGDFLEAIGASDASSQLVEFWPPMGPCWDALGVVTDPMGRLKPGAILVEAKSHIAEIYGNGCKAMGASLAKIERALTETKAWLSVENDPDWLGPLYQYANRLAHLYFVLKRFGKPVWLVNLYFLDDPIGPTSEQQWRVEIQKVKDTLGLAAPIPNAVDVFIPATSKNEVGPHR